MFYLAVSLTSPMLTLGLLIKSLEVKKSVC